MTSQSLGWLTVAGGPDGKVEAVATLGPPGTSSERAAHLLWAQLAPSPLDPPAVQLHDTYEAAVAAVLDGEASHVVVANAYRAVNDFYMDTRLALSSAYVMDTPLYGLASARDAASVPRTPTIASHPSPLPLIRQLLPVPFTPGPIAVQNSTSAAARAVRDGETDLALTTVPAAEAYGLTFLSRLRPIRMLWSVFTRSEQDPRC